MKVIDQIWRRRARYSVRSTTVRCAACACVALILATSAAIAQVAPAPQSIRGRIVAADDDRPLRRALVTPSGANRGARPVLTDDEGRFEIRLSDPSASLTITKAGYASTRHTPPRRSSSRDGDLVVRLSRGGVVSGNVVDSNGEAAIGMKIVARIEGSATDDGRTFEAEANDLGEYRIGGLPAGRYTVSPAATGPRVLTVADYQQIQALMKQGRSFSDVFLQPTGPPRSVEVRSGEESGSLDFEVPASHTVRALVPVQNRVQTNASQPPSGSTGASTPTSIFIGPQQTELQGGRVLSMFGTEGPRSMDLALSGGGSVSGSVVDSAGEPFQGITLRALHVRHENGRLVARAAVWPSVTDDRGRYRLFGLAPGSYLIVAWLEATEFAEGGQRPTGFAPLHFPGTTQIEAAQTLLVEADSSLTGADLTFAASPAARVTGKALDVMGQPVIGRVSLGTSQRSGAIASDPRVVRTGREGTFEVIDVAPGDYVLQATADASFGGPAEFGSVYVTVTDRDPPPVVITTSRGATLEGRFVVEGMPDPPMRAYSLHAAPMDLDRSPAGGRGPTSLGIHDDGRFYLKGLFGPMRLTAPNTLPGWYLKSVTIGGVDVTDSSYDFGVDETTVGDAQIVLSNSGARLTGSIASQPGSRASSAVVMAFSTNRDNWFDGSRRTRRSASTPKWTFEVTGLPPGAYFVAAVDAAAPLDWQAPETLESLVPRATRVTVEESQTQTIELRLIRR